MRKYLLIIDRNKASLGKRFVNNLIDTIVLMIIHVILTFISGFLYALTSICFFYFYNDGGFLWDIFIGAVVAFIYFFIWEYYTQGMTPGKYVTGTRVISVDGKKSDRKQILYISLYRVIPFEPLSFFGREGWHDSFSDTRVVNWLNYISEKQAKDDINRIGQKEIA
ncbi:MULTISPECIES: RDD family protein [Chryseobacterium]|uniref:RDD family membrane protein YckC n=1 Tax=Chryseobacterium camelliae TaxID=1265445 RepID=A0ABU0TK86_9FLAO|nr:MULTISPECIES: RDD family protein [Chryseobacterium]MDT3408683.1 putative RDD family membrane protein YckC [Pseudacidovorax intermedius]MDQ1097463.1 putative RDD family membrane protein YckC [Chryseobacterium camelliae]MDQ1101392.1 putative RDD family membrane protein YckC [Chryseobacterium sp. SORGH_AS_1048]MDR6084836.1 putative RDD family membrane protein YckC [Chryseobacterium sp. SORGH_AS_0909]MDR6129185.1 putative RDD family membrane protein YckC [Chryseobacterium sp. SORGH_AS_1175]